MWSCKTIRISNFLKWLYKRKVNKVILIKQQLLTSPMIDEGVLSYGKLRKTLTLPWRFKAEMFRFTRIALTSFTESTRRSSRKDYKYF